MKKWKILVAVLLTLIMVMTFLCGCTDPNAGNGEGEGGGETPPQHEHNFVEFSRSAPTCDSVGKINYACDCGEIQRETIQALGHNIIGEDKSAAYARVCARKGCSYFSFHESNPAFAEQVVYTFDADDETRINSLYESLLSAMETIGAYDENDATHTTITEGSAVATAYAEFESDCEEYIAELEFVVGQYQFAQIQTDVASKNFEKRENFTKISAFYNDMYSNYNAIFQKVYDSAFRNYFYDDTWTAEEIAEILAESSKNADKEYTDLSKRNDEIEILHRSVNLYSDEFLTLFEEFVTNNNRIAEIQGYDNYMEYAYDTIYDREYSPADSIIRYNNIKQHISPVLVGWINNASRIDSSSWSELEQTQYNEILEGSYFEDRWANHTVNDFLAKLNVDKGDDTSFTYLDKMNDVIETGNYFRGTYAGAYTWYISALNSPIMYFGESYESSNTVIHEFGHYVNSWYNNEYEQSFDLDETHSQGLEVLYISDLKTQVENKVYNALYTENIANSLLTISLSAAVDRFEQAVYAGNFTGLDVDELLKDGKLSNDEYQALFDIILADLQLNRVPYLIGDYWRKVTIPSPGYYVSYSISLICSLQFVANEDNFADKVDSYLKLVTYTDVEANRTKTYQELLELAGLYSYNDPALYEYLGELLRLD